jgi:hypothetical protein
VELTAEERCEVSKSWETTGSVNARRRAQRKRPTAKKAWQHRDGTVSLWETGYREVSRCSPKLARKRLTVKVRAMRDVKILGHHAVSKCSLRMQGKRLTVKRNRKIKKAQGHTGKLGIELSVNARSTGDKVSLPQYIAIKAFAMCPG